MFVIDTNILVYAADEESPFHSGCRRSLEMWRGEVEPWFLTWGICYEFLRVVTHPKVFFRPWNVTAAWGFISALLDSHGAAILIATSHHGAIAREVFSLNPRLAGNLLHDAHTAILMREHGIRTIYTRDKDFLQFPFLDPVDPTQVID